MFDSLALPALTDIPARPLAVEDMVVHAGTTARVMEVTPNGFVRLRGIGLDTTTPMWGQEWWADMDEVKRGY